MPPRKAPTKRRKQPVNPDFSGKDRTLRQDLLHLRKLSRETLEAKAAADAKAVKKERFKQFVIDRMEFEKVDSQKADHTSFTPSYKVMAQVTDEAAFIAWAEKNDPDLVATPKPRKGDLNSLVKRLDDDGEELPPGVSKFVKRDMSMRASNG